MATVNDLPPLTLENEQLPVVYVDRGQLESFAADSAVMTEGVAYEWEDEQVVHLLTRPARHAYGRQHRVVFVRAGQHGDVTHDATFEVVVDRAPDGTVTARAYRRGLPLRNLRYIPARDQLYSRNKGILELNLLEGKTVTVIGLGSFGSQIAIELAKAGVGRFKLIDFDRVELHNLARHTCTLSELGRLKTDAIADAVLGKNPYAAVERYPVDINKNPALLDHAVAHSDLVIVATDNNKSRFNITSALARHGVTGIYGRAITRAEGGDVFVQRRGGPCYSCLIGRGLLTGNDEITDEASARRDGRIPAYVSPEQANAIVQVGLSADIAPICNMMVKLALVELSRGKPSGISSLERELVYDFYMWANRRETKYANWHALPGAGALPTIMRWYGAHIERNEGCPVCGGTIDVDTLDQGHAHEQRLGDTMDNYDGLSLDDALGNN